MRFVGGRSQEQFVERIRGKDPARCLMVPVDVGKRAAAALVSDLYGQVAVDAFRFDLDEPGVERFLETVDEVSGERDAQLVRVGVEAAGHYHRVLMGRLAGEEHLEVVELNPGHVNEMRGRQGRRRLKTDETDLAAAAELLARGGGTRPRDAETAMAVQRVFAGHRQRKVWARSGLSNQIQVLADQLFPGLTDCYWKMMRAKSAWVILAEICDPVRIRRLGAKRLQRFVANRGVAMKHKKAERITAAARESLALPSKQREALQTALTADMSLFTGLSDAIGHAEQEMSRVLPDTPAGVLTSLPGIAVVRASNYGAAIGDPHRYDSAAAAYRTSGLVPSEHQSADTSYEGQPISREGRVEARRAIVELGRGLADHDPEFAAYRDQLRNRNKPKGIVAVAVGRRAHRLAFAMMRDQTVYDPDAWKAGVAAGRSVMTGNKACQLDVATPPPTPASTTTTRSTTRT